MSVYLDDAAAQLEAEIRLAPEWPEEWWLGSDGRYHAEGWISAEFPICNLGGHHSNVRLVNTHDYYKRDEFCPACLRMRAARKYR